MNVGVQISLLHADLHPSDIGQEMVWQDYMNFRIEFSIFMKNDIRIFEGLALNI
jgi:hypothetical protein